MKVHFVNIPERDRRQLAAFLDKIPSKVQKKVTSITYTSQKPVPHGKAHVHGFVPFNSGKIVIFCGIHPITRKRKKIWQLIHVTLHEMGHAFYRHNKNSRGIEKKADEFATEMYHELIST